MSTHDGSPLDAGEFGSWMTEIAGAIAGENDADVPCGSCTACCTSSQFIHVGPDEIDALAHIPVRLRFAAPRMARGHVLIGYDERGRCPMLIEGTCSIYDHRPRTCRTYDCRVFPAADLEPDDGKKLIAERSDRWTFTYGDDDSKTMHEAVRAAAAYVRDHADELPEGAAPVTTTQAAVLAVRLSGMFVERSTQDGHIQRSQPEPRAVRVELSRLRH